MLSADRIVRYAVMLRLIKKKSSDDGQSDFLKDKMETVVEKGGDSFFGLNITAVLAQNSASCHGRIFSLQTMIVVAHESSYIYYMN